MQSSLSSQCQVFFKQAPLEQANSSGPHFLGADKKEHEKFKTTLFFKQECNEAANPNSGLLEKSTTSRQLCVNDSGLACFRHFVSFRSFNRFVLAVSFRLFRWLDFLSRADWKFYFSYLKEGESALGLSLSLSFTTATCTSVTFVTFLYTNLHRWNCLHWGYYRRDMSIASGREIQPNRCDCNGSWHTGDQLKDQHQTMLSPTPV